MATEMLMCIVGFQYVDIVLETVRSQRRRRGSVVVVVVVAVVIL